MSDLLEGAEIWQLHYHQYLKEGIRISLKFIYLFFQINFNSNRKDLATRAPFWWRKTSCFFEKKVEVNALAHIISFELQK